MEEDQRHYEKLTSILQEKHRRELLEAGKTEKEAERAAQKRAIEDARFRSSQRLHHETDLHAERQIALEFLFPSLLQPRAVGNSRCRLPDAWPCEGKGAPHFCHRRPAVPARRLSGRQDVLRQGRGSAAVPSG